MWKRRKLCLLILAAALCGPGAAAQWEIKHTNYYLTVKQQQLPEFPPPPSAGSKADLADLAALHEWQGKRTEAQCARANSEADADYTQVFGDISPFPSPLPSGAAEVLKRVKEETDGIVVNVKNKFNRPRPFNRDAGLEPCLGRIGAQAYPSGHAAISRVYALILSDLVPEHRAVFMARADKAGLHRIIGGVHYPTDVEAGKKLADALYRMYLKSPAFRADVKTLRAHLPRIPTGSQK
jgi:acid phosphatase (class A)